MWTDNGTELRFTTRESVDAVRAMRQSLVEAAIAPVTLSIFIIVAFWMGTAGVSLG